MKIERLTFNDSDGNKITSLHAALLVGLVLPANFFILSYTAMLLIGALHSGVTQFPALGFWMSACAVALFHVLGWDGPIAYKAAKPSR